MHLLDRFGSICGVKPSTPKIQESFYPLGMEKYITLNHTPATVSQKYDYMDDVTYELSTILNKENIKILQIGDKSDHPQLPHCIDMRGALNLKQMTYVIKRSLCHISPDSFCGDIANLTATPNIQIFGPTPPYFLSSKWVKEVTQVLTPEVSYVPSFQNEVAENKIINKIRPEKITESIVTILDLQANLTAGKTIFVGNKYHNKLLEAVPNFAPHDSVFAQCNVHIRLDYEFNEKYLINWANNRKLILLSDQAIDVNLIRHIKPSILHIVYQVSDKTPPEHLAQVKNCGVPLHLFSKVSDDKELQDLRLKFLDWPIEQIEPSTKKNIDTSEKIDYSKLFYKSSKLILSNEKEYSSKAALLNDSPKINDDPCSIYDSEDFWEEVEHFRLIQK